MSARMKINVRYILNPISFLCLGTLLLNDHYLKQEYHNWITGKLSDVSGIVVLVLFLSAFITERYRSFIYFFSAVFFCFWKSPYSDLLIESWNTSGLYFISRVVDATDLFALLILIPLYKYEPKNISFHSSFRRALVLYPSCGITLFAMLATSRASHFRSDWMYVSETVTLRLDRAHFLDHLAKDNIRYTRDSVYIWGKDTLDRYILNNIIINKDTIQTAIIGILSKKKKLDIYIEKIRLSESGDYFFDDYTAYKKWIKKYQVETKDYFEKIRQ